MKKQKNALALEREIAQYLKELNRLVYERMATTGEPLQLAMLHAMNSKWKDIRSRLSPEAQEELMQEGLEARLAAEILRRHQITKKILKSRVH